MDLLISVLILLGCAFARDAALYGMGIKPYDDYEKPFKACLQDIFTNLVVAAALTAYVLDEGVSGFIGTWVGYSIGWCIIIFVKYGFKKSRR